MPPKLKPPSSERLDDLEKIWSEPCLLDVLCDPGRLEADAALALARQMMERYRDFDTRLVKELMAVPDVASGKNPRTERCLEILDEVSSGRRMIMPLMKLMNTENRRVRSKVARILGKRLENLSWTRKFLEEADDRTRANIIESLWGTDSPAIREVLWQAVEDGNNRMRGNAILALYRLGVGSVLPAIRGLVESHRPSCRATAAWLMGASGDPRFRGVVAQLRQDTHASVRAAALRALVQLNKEAANGPEPQIYSYDDLAGVRRVAFDLPESGAGRDLLAADVVLTENGQPVWEYSFAERRSCPVTALFLIFGDGLSAEVSANVWNAISECAVHSSGNDRWFVARLDRDVDELRSAQPPHRALELKTGGEHFEEAPHIPLEQLSKLVRFSGGQTPGRHLVLLLAPQALPDADLDALQLLALALHLIVDVVSLGRTGNERLQKLARKTDGIFRLAPEDGISAAWLEQAYRSMAHRYEVTYSLAASADAGFEIKIMPPRTERHGGRTNPTRPNMPAG